MKLFPPRRAAILNPATCAPPTPTVGKPKPTFVSPVPFPVPSVANFVPFPASGPTCLNLQRLPQDRLSVCTAPTPPPRLGYLAREHILASPPSNGPPCGPDAVGRECRKNKTQINTEFNHEKAPGRFCSRQRTMNGDAGLVGCLVDRLTTRVRVISSSRGFPWIPSANGLPTTTHGS
jgi:hypothetical protein